MGQGPVFSTKPVLHEAKAERAMYSYRDVPVLHHPGYTRPLPLVLYVRGMTGRADWTKSVLWAHNRTCFKLKWTHIDFWRGLSGLWLGFKARVARTDWFQRPQGTYIYPFHLCVLHVWYPYPNEIGS